MELQDNRRFTMTEHESLPAPAYIKQLLPLAPVQRDFISSSRQTLKDILDGQDPRLIAIVGPCSIHDLKAAREYAQKLAGLAKEVEDVFMLVMRVYYEKPRTLTGWKGFLYDPYLDGSHKIAEGFLLIRQLMLDLCEMGIPIASELLDPLATCYFNDLISWGCIGARTATSQIHRQLVSQYNMPIAFKNTTDGNIENAIHGILAARTPHSSLGLNEEGQIALIRSQGNPYGHLILRGSESSINFDSESIEKALNCLKKHRLSPRLVIDCSHDNSKRQPEKQALAFQSVIHQYLSGNCGIRGLMLESNLEGGSQLLPRDLSELQYGMSITDPCLNWSSTEMLLKTFYTKIKQSWEYSPSVNINN